MSGDEAAMFVAINMGVFASAVLVLTMQPGFMLLEAGAVSRKNTINNLFKNIIDFTAGGLVFWAVGYMTFSGEGPVVALLGEWGLTQTPAPAAPGALGPAEPMYFLFQLGFASAAVTISSGAVTGRISPYAYLLFAMIFTGLIYPIVGFLVWHPAGGLYGVFSDFAGGVVVHSVGAAAGLAGAVMLRPRLGYNGYDPIGLGDERLFRIATSHAPHNTPISALGVMLLWIGWFGFNGGTLLAGGFPAADAVSAMDTFGRISVNTALAPCAAVTMMLVIQAALGVDFNMTDLLNALIAGLVAVTATADQLSPLSAVIAGAGGAVIYRLTRGMMVAMSIDDPVGAVAAHGATGVFGAACLALASAPGAWLDVALQQTAYGSAIFFAVFIASAVAFKVSDILCKVGAVLMGRASLGDAWRRSFLRVHYRVEIEGLDEALHGQDAYNFKSIV